ncbi:MAG TPA: ArsA-related P-loop ATPase [Myxococcaceae bacterium]|nr:ArsA-related P-loop ATPase [Myxococcaceae bacterium]
MSDLASPSRSEAAAPANPLSEALLRNDVLVCVGEGGVGKTTIAATIALRAAVQGKTSLVCTIDPARRLASSLGLSELGNTESRIPPEHLQAAGLSAEAPMYAMMLDTKRTWDEFVERYAPADKREQILASRFYQSLSSALAGSQEYIAMEKLWQLHSKKDYQLIVLDTPPTSHALDFLDAPNRVLDFLDNDAARWLLRPALVAGRWGLQIFSFGGNYMAKTLAKLTGTDTLGELAEFMLAISGMNESFRERASQVRELLAADRTSFVLVTAPRSEGIEEVAQFQRVLQQNHMSIAAVVLNRVQPPPLPSDWTEAAQEQGALRAKLEATLEERQRAAERDAEASAAIRSVCEPTPLIEVPALPTDVHDLVGLWRTGRFLFGEERLQAAQW